MRERKDEASVVVGTPARRKQWGCRRACDSLSRGCMEGCVQRRRTQWGFRRRGSWARNVGARNRSTLCALLSRYSSRGEYILAMRIRKRMLPKTSYDIAPVQLSLSTINKLFRVAGPPSSLGPGEPCAGCIRRVLRPKSSPSVLGWAGRGSAHPEGASPRQGRSPAGRSGRVLARLRHTLALTPVVAGDACSMFRCVPKGGGGSANASESAPGWQLSERRPQR